MFSEKKLGKAKRHTASAKSRMAAAFQRVKNNMEKHFLIAAGLELADPFKLREKNLKLWALMFVLNLASSANGKSRGAMALKRL